MKKITLLLLLAFATHMHSQIIFSEDFETITDLSASGWTLYNDNNTPQPNYATIITDAWNIATWTAENGNTTASTTSWFNPPGTADRWLITPSISLPAGNASLSYKIRSHDNGNFADGYILKISTTGTAKADFTTDLVTVPNAPNDIIANVPITTVDLSPYAGQTVYLAWVNQFNDGNLLSVDDIFVNAGCSSPSGLSFDDFSTTTADISWSNDPGDFDIEYGLFPYTLGSGGTQTSVTNANSFQLTNLMPGVSYNVFVRQDCGGGDLSDYQEVVVGTSPNLVTAYPFSEDFEPDADQALILNLGVSFLSNVGNWGFTIDDPNDMDEDFAFDGVACFFSNSTFTDSDADAYLYLGPFDMTANTQYDISFQQRNLVASDGTTPNKDMELTIAQNPDGLNDNVIASFIDMDNTTYQQRSGAFTPSTSGSYYIGFHDISAVLTGVTAANVVFIDAVSVDATLSVNEFDVNKVDYFVDAQNILNLSANQAFESITIHNLLGQQVLSQNLNSQDETIDLNALTSGVYLSKVQLNGASKTFKIIKK